ncbi:F-box domain containing protein, partial [Tanacetum coccineum]
MDIMNKLPVKSLLQFRTVSKKWKSSIDYSNFTVITVFVRQITIKRSSQAVVGDQNFWAGSERFASDDARKLSRILRSFSLGDFQIIYAWVLEVDGGFVSSYRMLFTIPFPAEHVLKLLGFSKDEEAIVEANNIQQIPHSLQ